jgi:3-phytase
MALVIAALLTSVTYAAPASGSGPLTVRFATFNASLNRSDAGELVSDLSTPNNVQAKTVAEIIQRTRPDVLLINEFDFVEKRVAAQLFQTTIYLRVSEWRSPN